MDRQPIPSFEKGKDGVERATVQLNVTLTRSEYDKMLVASRRRIKDADGISMLSAMVPKFIDVLHYIGGPEGLLNWLDGQFADIKEELRRHRINERKEPKRQVR